MQIIKGGKGGGVELDNSKVVRTENLVEDKNYSTPSLKMPIPVRLRQHKMSLLQHHDQPQVAELSNRSFSRTSMEDS